MSKGKHRRKPQPIAAEPSVPNVALPPIPPGATPPNYNPQGPGEQRDVIASKDGWSEYTLSDGTVLRLKAALLDAKRAVNQYSPDGSPLYVFQFTIINQVIAPKSLYKKS
jgi:hypothetical protein